MSHAIKPTHCIKLCVVKLCVGKSRGSSFLPLLSPTMPFLGASVVLIIKPVFTLKLLCCWCGTVSCNSHHHSSFDSWRKYKSELFKAKPKPFGLTSTSSSRVDLSYTLPFASQTVRGAVNPALARPHLVKILSLYSLKDRSIFMWLPRFFVHLVLYTIIFLHGIKQYSVEKGTTVFGLHS